MLLTKGLEIEQYTGLVTGEALPLSATISQNLSNFSVEPDQRNVEYITPVCLSYQELCSSLIKPRLELREFLKLQNADWTVLPSSTLALPFEKSFIFSKPEDIYHQHIKQRHGLSIITASTHYNIGIPDSNEIIRLVDLMRLEACLMLALTASSPFYDGENTGYQSYRWASFPKVPNIIPFFGNIQNFINWTEQMLETGEMFNIRHFWGAVRPNGSARPHNLNRLEVRICDLSTNWETTLAIMAWIEARVHYFLENPDLIVPSNDESLILLSDENELSTAQNGLSAHFSDWLYGEESTVYEAIQKRLEDIKPIAQKLELNSYLKPIENILVNGSESSHKILRANNYSVKDIMQEWIQESLEADLRCLSLVKNFNY